MFVICTHKAAAFLNKDICLFRPFLIVLVALPQHHDWVRCPAIAFSEKLATSTDPTILPIFIASEKSKWKETLRK
jgi:hypothetical protein